MRSLMLFDGLGGTQDTLLSGLRELRTRPENQAYFECLFQALDQVREHVGPDVWEATTPHGFALRRWLDGTATPPADAMRNSVVAGVCVHAHQACALQPIAAGVQTAVAALGHSIGLQAAVLAGLRPRRLDEFLALAATSVRLVATSLIRGHQAAADSGTDDLARRYVLRHARAVAPSPMASVTGLTRHEVHAAVREFDRDGSRTVTLSLANSPTAHVLSGSTEDLLDFYFAHDTAFERGRTRWAFLANTIPFHSTRLASAATLTRDDLDLIGALPSPERLVLPVYATDAARDLRASTDLVTEFLQQVLVAPIDWESACTHAITDAGVDHVVDFGPGQGARRFTRECLRDAARGIRFESVQQFSRRVR